MMNNDKNNIAENVTAECTERDRYRLYILFKEHKRSNIRAVQFLVHYICGKADLDDFGTGNAYNMPDYLLDAIEGYEETAMVVAWDMENDEPRPRFLVSPSEICPLIEALKNEPNGDAWDIAVRVNKEIRAAEEYDD